MCGCARVPVARVRGARGGVPFDYVSPVRIPYKDRGESAFRTFDQYCSLTVKASLGLLPAAIGYLGGSLREYPVK